MTDTAMFSSFFGFTLLLLGLALTAFEFNRIRRQRRQLVRVAPRQSARLRSAPHAAMRGC